MPISADDFPVGMKLYFVDQPWHVRGTVDGLVVLRMWQEHKRRWRYDVTTPEIVQSLYSRTKAPRDDRGVVPSGWARRPPLTLKKRVFVLRG